MGAWNDVYIGRAGLKNVDIRNELQELSVNDTIRKYRTKQSGVSGQNKGWTAVYSCLQV